MFTGLVSAVVRVRRLAEAAAGARLTLEKPAGWTDVREGESVAVSGVCLTVLPATGADLSFDVSPETLRRSTLGGLTPRDRVNLERALAAGDRLGGHIVAGHVDATTEVLDVGRTGEFFTFRFGLDASWARYVVEKGSIALDGVSLTVATLGSGSFEVAVIPHTYAATTLGQRSPGDRVNVEVDLVGKYVERLLQPYAARPAGSTGSVAGDERLERLLRG